MIPSSPRSEYQDFESEPGEERSKGRRKRSSPRRAQDERTRPVGPPRNRWLSIDAACKMIGVDQSTMRRWSDNGKIPVFRTPGGHRRYAEDDLRAFLRGESRTRQRVSRQELTSMSMEGYARDYVDEAAERPWYQAYDRDTLDAMRGLGRRMVELSIRYLSGRGNKETLLAESRVIGRQYGQHSAAAGLSTSQALEAFLFFRKPVFNAVNHYIEREHLNHDRSSTIMDELVTYMDEVLLTTIKAHEESRGRQ